MAQITTASLRGVVNDSSDQILAGAVVSLSHPVTGTVYTVAPDAEGHYSIHGIRPDNGYRLEVNYVGYKSYFIDDMVLHVGDTRVENITMKEDSMLDAVVVASSSREDADMLAKFDEKTIELIPSVSRSLYDIVRLVPEAMATKNGGMSYGGVNNRYNSFMINGMANSDMYGLSTSGTNGGLSNANPVAMDAISQIQVAVAPYDVRLSGFGGGVGACPTGETLIVNKDGAAIYGNEASGTNMSGGGNNKTYDSTLAQTSEIFTRNGYADYFCVRARDGANNPISLVTGLMAGGGAANWTGSCDEQPVSIGPSGYAAAKYLFGLDAHPDGAAKSQAVNAAKVIITGNHSNIHGGGIMTNGGLILGRKDEIVTATPALDITGTKALLKDGAAQESGRDFHFLLKNSTGEEVGTATADAATGQFTISPNVQYTQAGTYTYTLSEVNDNRPGITYDTKEYTIQVTIEEKTVSLLGVTFKSYNVASVTLDGSESGGSSGSGGDSQTGTFRVRYQNGNNWDIVNVYVWDAAGNKIVGEWPGQPMTKDTDGTYYYDLSVNGTGKYNYIFSNNGNTQTPDIDNIPYAPGKEVVFDVVGKVVSNTAGGSSGSGDAVGHGSNSDGSYTLTIPGDAFTNTMTTQLNLQITKTDSVDASKLLEGAKFTLKEQGTENSMEVTTDKDGIALFSGIRRNTTYDLRETQAPSNYMTAGPWILEVRDGDATLYPATENPDGTLEKASDTDTGTALTVTTGTDSKVLELPIQDTLWGYELPDTGGAGTTSYTTGGLALIFGAATLLYIHCRRRKEDEVSS